MGVKEPAMDEDAFWRLIEAANSQAAHA